MRGVATSFVASADTSYRGVSRDRNKFQATVCRNGVAHFCGTHDTAETSALAWDAKARTLRMREKELNFPHGQPRTDGYPTERVVAPKSGQRGVQNLRECMFKAELWFDGRGFCCGRHVWPETAARAYDAAARELGFDEETLNFPMTRSRSRRRRPSTSPAQRAFAASTSSGTSSRLSSSSRVSSRSVGPSSAASTRPRRMRRAPSTPPPASAARERPESAALPRGRSTFPTAYRAPPPPHRRPQLAASARAITGRPKRP